MIDKDNTTSVSSENQPKEIEIFETPPEPVLEEVRSEKEIIAKLETRHRKEVDEFDQKVLDVARVTRVTKGGKRFTFRATVVVGNYNGRVGVGTGRGVDVARAVEKALRLAKKYSVLVSMKQNTIPHSVEVKYASAVVMLKPASAGSGVKAGGPVRILAKLAGISDITGKLISRTNNKINIARATIEAFKRLKNLESRK